MITYLYAQFDTAIEDSSPEVPLVYNIADDGTTVKDAVAEANDAVEAEDASGEELEKAA